MLNTDKLCPGCMKESNESSNVCELCGYDKSANNHSEYLPTRFLLANRYFVGKTTSVDCEGVTYVGFDCAEGKKVNIKEYFPSEIAKRNPDKTVSVISGEEFAFNEGLMNFIEIGKKLLHSELVSLIPVLDIFEENSTAYRINESYSGITLKDFLSRNGGTLRWEQVRPLLLPLLDTVIGLNEAGIVHCGISPETVMVGRDGRLRLTDIFVPSARKAGGAILPELYNGYAAIEQYGNYDIEVSDYTDVYGLSATLLNILVGNELTAACERVGNSGMSIPAHLADELPRQVLVALANGLQVMPKDRTATVEIFKNELVYGETQENVRKSEMKRNAEKTESKNEGKGGSAVKYVAISAVCTVVAFALIAAILCLTVLRGRIFGGDDEIIDSEISFVTPSVDAIGDYDSDAVESKRLYSVPSLLGQYYSQIVDNEEYENFKFVIKDKEFSNKYARGTICAQSLAEGSNVERETEIALTISLGSPEVKVPNVLGLDEASAKIELLKQGFLYENIEVIEKYDEESKPGIVLEQSPKINDTVSTEITVRIYVNSFEGIGEGGSDFDGTFE